MEESIEVLEARIDFQRQKLTEECRESPENQVRGVQEARIQRIRALNDRIIILRSRGPQKPLEAVYEEAHA